MGRFITQDYHMAKIGQNRLTDLQYPVSLRYYEQEKRVTVRGAQPSPGVLVAFCGAPTP
jgi:hypothetical protein